MVTLFLFFLFMTPFTTDGTIQNVCRKILMMTVIKINQCYSTQPQCFAQRHGNTNCTIANLPL